MSPGHHPTEAWLVDFASGSLPGPARMVVQAHLSVCPACAATLAAAEAVGGAMLADLQPAALQPDALALALARIERPVPPAPAEVASPPGWIEVPTEVTRAMRRRRRLAPGVWVAPVQRNREGVRSYLLGIPRGVSLPHHTHQSWEITVVLKGAFRDADELYTAGDFIETDPSIRHSPRVTADGDCVCLAATEGSLIGLDVFGRVLIPLLGL